MQEPHSEPSTFPDWLASDGDVGGGATSAGYGVKPTGTEDPRRASNVPQSMTEDTWDSSDEPAGYSDRPFDYMLAAANAVACAGQCVVQQWQMLRGGAAVGGYAPR